MSLRFSVLLSLIVVSTGCGEVQTDRVTSVDTAAVRIAIDAGNERFLTGFRTADVPLIMENYHADAILLPPGTEMVRGTQAISDFFAGMLGTMTISEPSLTTTDLVIVGQTAYETGTYSMTMQIGTAAPPMADRGKYLVVWSRGADGNWRITREIFNSSLPPQP